MVGRQDSAARLCAAAATECGADAAYCASHPFVRGRRHGLFVALHNSYFAATVATKAYVAAFARTRGWNRTRHKAYGVREFSAIINMPQAAILAVGGGPPEAARPLAGVR